MNYRVLVFLFFVIGFRGILFSQTPMNYEKIELEFTSDTTRVERENRELLDKDYSTLGMIDASVEYEKKYDVLLNKYYRLLYNSLGETGKKALKSSQLNWIKFRDSEKDLISEINDQTYEEAGGGTIWGVIASGSRSELTKKRVIELYNYLMYGYLGG